MTETTRRPPLRVTLADEGELVTAGFTAMLAPYRHRVVVVPPSEAVRPADLILHDWPSRTVSTDGPIAGPRDGAGGGGGFVVYTWNAQPGLVRLALARGARGCLSKTMSAASLVAALERIHEGAVLVEGGLGQAGGGEGSLTPREAEIITLITLGFDNYQVADQASLSINSVKSYVRTAYRKMGVASRSQAVLWGVRHGYVSYPIVDWPIEEPLEYEAPMTPVA